MKKWVLLYSGGLDSTVALFDLLARKDEVACLSIIYGQRHRKELELAAHITKTLGVQHQVIDLGALRPIMTGNSQTDSSVEVPEGHYTEESMKLTVVPNRNMIFLSVAMAAALSKNFDGVVYAAHGGDHAIYPDCRPEFVRAIQEVAKICDWKQLEVFAPFLAKTKSEIVLRGMDLDVPFSKTWSCYKGGEKHCGKCGTCVERKEAFALAKVSDPTIYESAN